MPKVSPYSDSQNIENQDLLKYLTADKTGCKIQRMGSSRWIGFVHTERVDSSGKFVVNVIVALVVTVAAFMAISNLIQSGQIPPAPLGLEFASRGLPAMV